MREDVLKASVKVYCEATIKKAGFSLERAKLVLSDFSNICGDSKWYGDLALYFAECATDFTMSYGDIDAKFYDALGDAYHEAVTMASENEELYRSWKDRLEYIYHEFSGFGWGMDDYITGEYYSIPWLEGGLEDGDY